MAAQAEASVRLSLIDRISAPIRRIQARMAALSRGLGIDRIATSFGALTTRIGGLGSAIAATSGRFASLAALAGFGAGGVAAVLFDVTKGVADVGAELTESSFKLGIGVEALQEYRYAAMMAGIEQDALTTAMQKLGVNASAAANGNKGMADNFASLGVAVRDANGGMRDMESVLADTFAALALIEEPTRRNELAFRLFGKSGVDMVKMLADGEAGLIAMREEARQTGHVMSADAAAMGDTFGDNIDRLMTRLEGLKLFLGVQLLPVMDELVTSVTDWVSANQELVRSTISEWVGRLATLLTDLMNPASEIRVSFDNMAEAVSNVANAITPLINFLGGPGNATLLALGAYIGGPLIAAILGLIPPIVSLGVTIMATPIGWILGGLALLGAAIYLVATNWDAVVAAWGAAWATLGEAWNLFTADMKAAWDGVTEWVGGLGASAMAAWAPVSAWGAGLAAEVTSWFQIDLFAVGQAIVATLLAGLQSAWGQVTGWLSGAVDGLISAIPEWARGPLGIQVSGKPMTDSDMASRARQAGQSAADRVPGAGWFDSQENKDASSQAKALAFLQAEGAALSRLRADNAQAAGPGAALQAPVATIAPPSAVPVETPTVTAGTVTTSSLNVPEPLLVHQPQAVDARYIGGPVTITVPPGFTAAQAQSMINGALSRQASEHQAGVSSALND